MSCIDEGRRMQAPLQSRNESDAVETKPRQAATQERTLVDNRPAALAQRKLADMIQDGPAVRQQRALRDAFHDSPRLAAQGRKMHALFGGTVQRHDDHATTPQSLSDGRGDKHAVGGLPPELKSGMESLSGMRPDHG
jgi:hypothetical protein